MSALIFRPVTRANVAGLLNEVQEGKETPDDEPRGVRTPNACEEEDEAVENPGFPNNAAPGEEEGTLLAGKQPNPKPPEGAGEAKENVALAGGFAGLGTGAPKGDRWVAPKGDGCDPKGDGWAAPKSDG